MSRSTKRFYLLSLGCSKNTVDSTSMAGLLDASGYHAVADARDAQVLIVNTCGFIGPAKQESVNALRELAEGKRPGQILIAAGCLSQRYGVALARAVPGLDGIIGTRRWMDIVDLVTRLRQRRNHEPIYHLPETGVVPPPAPPAMRGGSGADDYGAPRAAVQGRSAYLKIADGCRRPCAFCAIPLIKGPAVSRPPERIVAEARQLVDAGVQELLLIAQDTTDYGTDLGLHDGLATLLEQLAAAAPDARWIRLMYAYPGAVTPRLIDVMAAHPQIAHYLDIPLQHGHRDVLRRMRRPANVEWVYRTLERMRAAMPDLAVRTTFIVGYPGETENEFEALVKFVQDLQFDRVGCFTYSYEDHTPSAALEDQLPLEVKNERRDRLMAVQQPISLARNQAQVGRTLDMLVEGVGDGLSVGRSYRDAPEIDGMVIVEGDLPVGEFVPVRISGAMEYDLTGTVATGTPVVII
jgi:ribosomal protein S12 methylthiotransferase